MASASPAPVVGANALDVNMEQNNEQIISPEIKTNYQQIQDTTPLEDLSVENFLQEEQQLENKDMLSTEVEQSSQQLDTMVAEEEESPPQLFSGDQDLNDNQNEAVLESNELDTDLSELNFDDKDDLEIPAFLRRQTN